MIEFFHFLGLLSALVLSFISSGMETALYRVSRVRMRIRAERGERRARWVNRTLDRMDGMVTTILLDNNIAAYAGTYFLTVQLAEWNVPQAPLVTTAVITPLFFVLTESLPKQLAYSRADMWTLELVRAFAVFRIVLSPMVWLLNRASALLRRLLGTGGDADLGQSRRTLLLEHLNAGVAENVLTAEQNRMAARIMELECIDAGDSMIPLARLTRIHAGATRARAVKEMDRRRSREALLVDAAGRPTGQAVTLDALIRKAGKPDDPVLDAAETLERIRADATIPDVLKLFRNRHARRALVMNRNQAAGVITSRTVLDRIAGINRY